MDSLVHPTQLSVWQRYLQARRLHKETSRSKNPDWFRSALELDHQLHLFVEDDEVSDAHLFSRQASKNAWTRVSAPAADLDEEGLTQYISALRTEHVGNKARSIGIVLHLADEFAISELAHSNERPEDFTELSQKLINSPQEVVEDHSTSTGELSFRLFPIRVKLSIP